MLYCGSEPEGLDVFYKLLDEFKNRDKIDEVATKDSFAASNVEIDVLH